jgi:hypothetical protein
VGHTRNLPGEFFLWSGPLVWLIAIAHNFHPELCCCMNWCHSFDDARQINVMLFSLFLQGTYSYHEIYVDVFSQPWQGYQLVFQWLKLELQMPFQPSWINPWLFVD